MDDITEVKTRDIDPRLFDLYGEYCHGCIDRREFFARAGALAVGGGTALAMAAALLPQYAKAQTISFTDERIRPRYVDYPSPGGTSGTMRGYLVAPDDDGLFPAVLVIHENCGLNPHIEDVARRAAVAGFLALAPDGLAPIGGYPGNDDDGRAMQRTLDRGKLLRDMLNSAYFLKNHELSSGKLGATGFCWGGGATNHLAVVMGGDLQAAVPFHGPAPKSEEIAEIRAALLVHYAEEDPRINAMRADFKAALEAAGVRFEMHTYPGTRHGFHNNSTPRYSEEVARLAWERTIDFFGKHLS